VKLLINLVIFDKPKILAGLDPKMGDGLFVYVLRAQGQKYHQRKGRGYPPVGPAKAAPTELPTSTPQGADCVASGSAHQADEAAGFLADLSGHNPIGSANRTLNTHE
jgi:hypothetical protein